MRETETLASHQPSPWHRFNFTTRTGTPQKADNNRWYFLQPSIENWYNHPRGAWHMIYTCYDRHFHIPSSQCSPENIAATFCSTWNASGSCQGFFRSNYIKKASKHPWRLLLSERAKQLWLLNVLHFLSKIWTISLKLIGTCISVTNLWEWNKM